MTQHLHPILEFLTSFVPYLASIMGKDYEIALFNIKQNSKEIEILTVNNAHESGPSLSKSLINFAKPFVDDFYKTDSPQFLVNKSIDQAIYSHAFFIKDDSLSLIGMLLINYDTTKALVAKELIDQLLTGTDVISPIRQKPLKTDGNIDQLLNQGLQKVKTILGKPLVLCSKQEKLDAMKILDKEGFFMLKGSVDLIAKQTGNTKYTIYSYLRTIRGSDEPEGFERGYI